MQLISKPYIYDINLIPRTSRPPELCTGRRNVHHMDDFNPQCQAVKPDSFVFKEESEERASAPARARDYVGKARDLPRYVGKRPKPWPNR